MHVLVCVSVCVYVCNFKTQWSSAAAEDPDEGTSSGQEAMDDYQCCVCVPAHAPAQQHTCSHPHKYCTSQ